MDAEQRWQLCSRKPWRALFLWFEEGKEEEKELLLRRHTRHFGSPDLAGAESYDCSQQLHCHLYFWWLYVLGQKSLTMEKRGINIRRWQAFTATLSVLVWEWANFGDTFTPIRKKSEFFNNIEILLLLVKLCKNCFTCYRELNKISQFLTLLITQSRMHFNLSYLEKLYFKINYMKNGKVIHDKLVCL